MVYYWSELTDNEKDEYVVKKKDEWREHCRLSKEQFVEEYHNTPYQTRKYLIQERTRELQQEWEEKLNINR